MNLSARIACRGTRLHLYSGAVRNKNKTYCNIVNIWTYNINKYYRIVTKWLQNDNLLISAMFT